MSPVGTHGRSTPLTAISAPAKTLAMMAIDLLHDDAKCARQILSENKPALTKDQYLQQQKSVFDTEVYEAV